MAEAITIPSPSVFLRASPPPSAPAPTPVKNVRRANAVEKKTKTPRKPGAAVSSGTDGGVAKPKQSKSRNGCVTCKTKRLKCGEEKPGCQQCARRNVECGGYKKDFKWRPFEETNVKLSIDKQKRGNSPKYVSPDSSKEPSPKIVNRPLKKSPGEKTPKDDSRKQRDSVFSDPEPANVNEEQLSKAVSANQRLQSSPIHSGSISPVEELMDELPGLAPPPLVIEETPSSSESSIISPAQLQPGSLAHLTPGLGLSPTLTEILLPFDGNNPEHQDFVHYHLPEGFQTQIFDDDIDLSLIGEGRPDEEIEEIMRDDMRNDHMVHGPLALLSASRLGSPKSPMSPCLHEGFRQPMNYIYPQPLFKEDSPEMLTFRFDRLTCGILSIMDGPTENPWRNLVWPLAQQSPALYHAITAMTAFHSAGDVPRLRLVGHEHKAASIQFIREGIGEHSMDDQTAIATAIALGFAEAWDRHTVTGNTHIKGAQALVRRALDDHKKKPLDGDNLSRLKFLCNAWVYMDVIARLTSVDSDDSNDFDNTFLFSSNPSDCPPVVFGDGDSRGFGIDFGMPIDAHLDPLMGCANTLFPWIGRVANLVRKVCRSHTNSPWIISQANDLKTLLEGWDPPAFIESPEDPTTDVEHTLQTAEAYRWATLLHLHRSVPELPSPTSAELAERVLGDLATIPITSRTVIVHIYPLMVAGCEATTDDYRAWVRSRWIAMNDRMRIGIIEKCLMVTEEVWRRRDVYEKQPSSNRRLVATADLHPVRQRGQPVVVTPGGSMRPGSPGHTGIIYSYVKDEQDVKKDDKADSRKRAPQSRNGRDPRRGIDPAYTVRGHLHWIGVMWDWDWEILLG